MVQDLMQAVKANNFELVKSLKQDVNKTDKWGRTALIVAAKYGFVEMIECLQELGADIHAKSNMGRTPMHFAAMKNHVKAIKCLKDLGAYLDAKDNRDMTPIHLAVEDGFIETIKCLRGLGADIHAKDKKGNTPIHFAAWSGCLEIVRCLKELGADLDAKDDKKNTPLHDAAKKNHDGVVEFLLNHEADDRLENENGLTALEIAVEAKNWYVVKQFIIEDAFSDSHVENMIKNQIELLDCCGSAEEIAVLANLLASHDPSDVSYWNYLDFKGAVNKIKNLCLEDITKDQFAILSEIKSLENKIQSSEATESILDDLYCIVDNKLDEIRAEALRTLVSNKLDTRMNITENIAKYLTSEDLGNVVECMSLQNLLDGLKKSQLQEARNILTKLNPKIKGLDKSNLKPLAKKARTDNSDKKNLAPKLLEIAQNFATFTDGLTGIMTEDCCQALTTFKSKFDDLFDAVIKEQDSMQIEASRDCEMNKIGETSEAV